MLQTFRPLLQLLEKNRRPAGADLAAGQLAVKDGGCRVHILADKPRLGDLALTQQRCGLGRRTLLHDLGHRTRSPDICRLAVAAYRNQQKIVTENRQPLYWARIQQKIAETYYLEGKISANREALEEALACYHDALYIFETAKRAQAAEEARTGIAKTRQMLAELAPDAEEEETEDFTQP